MGTTWRTALIAGVVTAGVIAPVSATGAAGVAVPPVEAATVRTFAGVRSAEASPETGDVIIRGSAPDLGSLDGLNLATPIEGIAPTPNGDGYWLASASGRVAAFGDAAFHGDLTAIDLNFPVVAMVPTATGGGYWMAASDGGVFAFGDARFLGSMGAVRLNEPVVGMASTPTGRGYWLAASDGGIFSFGDAQFFGSTGAMRLNRPVVGMAATRSGSGYWLVATDGGMFTFGDAGFFGSAGGQVLDSPVEAMGPTSDGQGYWLATLGGQVFAFGSADDYADVEVTDGVVSDLAVRPQGDGIWLAIADVGDSVRMWQPGGLSPTVTAGIVRVAAESGAQGLVFHGGTVGMLTLRRDGVVVSSVTPGWRIPMTAMAVQPRPAIAMLGPHVATALSRGEVAMGERTARLRDARVGDVIEFIGWNGSIQSRRIGAIAPTLRTGSTELYFAGSDAAAFGFERELSAVLWGFGSRADVLAAIDRQVSRPAYSGLSPSWDPRPGDQVASTVGLKELFGEFEYLPLGGPIVMDADWVAANIGPVDLPIIGRLTCNVAAGAAMAAALAEVDAAGLAGAIDVADTRRSGGCWVPREIRGVSGGSISRHSWGAAIDINPSTNGFGATPSMDSRVVAIFRAQGFAWGGSWARPDGMHFEWTGPLG